MKRSRPLIDRFTEKYVVNAETGCWEWQAARNSHGYGQLWSNGRQDQAHRVAYELHVGPIPAGLFLDHLCRNRACVNPEHLEAVTPQENVLRSPDAPPAVNARKSKCSKGHSLSGDNLYVRPDGERCCRTCRRGALTTPATRAKRAASRRARRLRRQEAA